MVASAIPNPYEPSLNFLPLVIPRTHGDGIAGTLIQQIVIENCYNSQNSDTSSSGRNFGLADLIDEELKKINSTSF